MKQRGIADGWILLMVLGVTAGAVWYAYQTVDQRGYQRGRLEVQQRFDQYQHEVAEMGRKAQAHADAEKARQARVTQERSRGYEKRIASINAAYRRLRDDRAGGRPMPPIANAPVCPDGTADRDQLLAVLRAADEQTARLLELQRWVREQVSP